MKEISAGGVVYRKRDGKVEILLIQDRYGRWTLPKGKREAGETDEENALREIKEETNIGGKIMEHLHTIHYQYHHPQNGQIDKEVHYFLVEALTEEEAPQLEEINRVAWYDHVTAYRLQKERGYENNDLIFDLAYQKLNLH